MGQWEYKVVNTAGLISRWTKKGVEKDLAVLEQQMNQLGAEGWEMIEFTTIPVTGSWSTKITAYQYIAYFKRPLPN